MLDSQRYARLRPYLFHNTDASNLAGIGQRRHAIRREISKSSWYRYVAVWISHGRMPVDQRLARGRELAQDRGRVI